MSETTRRNKSRKGIITLFLFYSEFLIAFILDRITKHIVLSTIPENSFVEIFPFFYLRNIKNTGICFGFLDNPIYLPFLIVASFVALILFFILVHKNIQHLSKWSCLCLALVSGGISGNLIDRIAYKGVIDFIDFRIWPVFNLADTFIVCGVACLLVFYSRGKNASRMFQNR